MIRVQANDSTWLPPYTKGHIDGVQGVLIRHDELGNTYTLQCETGTVSGPVVTTTQEDIDVAEKNFNDAQR